MVEFAFDYRGNTTIVKTDGTEVVGYIFNRNTYGPEPFIEYFDESGEGPFTLRYSELANVKFTGKDTAAGQQLEGLARAQGAGEGGAGPRRRLSRILILTAVELEARALARQLELPALPSLPFPAFGRGTLRLAPVGLRAALLAARWPGLRLGLDQPLVISAGVCGALAPDLRAGDLILPESVHRPRRGAAQRDPDRLRSRGRARRPPPATARC